MNCRENFYQRKNRKMSISHKKEFGIYHWDTFDNETILVDEADTLEEAKQKVINKYDKRIKKSGADQVDIVDSKGNIVEKYPIS